MSFLRRLINANLKMSDWFDQRIFSGKPEYLQDGNIAVRPIVERYVKLGMHVYDVGGGKRPFFSLSEKSNLSFQVTGIDIDAQELEMAPAGAYNQTIASAIEEVAGTEDGDLVVCIAVLEHVEHVEKAIHSIASLLKVGGKAVIFLPSRNAIFARLNLLIPEKMKRSILFSVFPEKMSSAGFRSYYKNCTPRDIQRIALGTGMTVAEAHYYFISGYFRFFFPLHVLWRAWLVTFRLFANDQAAETFTFVLEKK